MKWIRGACATILLMGSLSSLAAESYQDRLAQVDRTDVDALFELVEW